VLPARLLADSEGLLGFGILREHALAHSGAVADDQELEFFPCLRLLYSQPLAGWTVLTDVMFQSLINTFMMHLSAG